MSLLSLTRRRRRRLRLSASVTVVLLMCCRHHRCRGNGRNFVVNSVAINSVVVKAMWSAM